MDLTLDSLGNQNRKQTTLRSKNISSKYGYAYISCLVQK